MVARSGAPFASLAMLFAALGLSRDQLVPWRNHWVACPWDRAIPVLDGLVASGLMELVPTQPRQQRPIMGVLCDCVLVPYGLVVAVSDWHRLYRVTDAGFTIAVSAAKRRWGPADDDDATDPCITREVPRGD